ncbi:hypothetical protein U9M48_025206 [Paspalum notatum var. saurae]|uniref:Uncharacterized protein n=1 Tax=Paspalum notatum var. saurae TaxID=547442 RepID=A0AAQ3TUG7_PASNO
MAGRCLQHKATREMASRRLQQTLCPVPAADRGEPPAAACSPAADMRGQQAASWIGVRGTARDMRGSKIERRLPGLWLVMSSEQKLCMEDGQPKQHAVPAQEGHGGHGPSLLTLCGFSFLTFNSGMAVYRSEGDIGTISFVVFSYLDLLLLFLCLRLYERTPAESPQREHLKMAVWLLTTMLTAAFSYKVAAIMPFPVQVLVWAMASATVLGGFYAFFLHREGTKA